MRRNIKTYLQQVIKKTAGQYILDFNLSWKQKRESYSLRSYFSCSIFVSVVLSHLFEVDLGRKRTCERRCRRRKSRRTFPVHRAEAEWGSAPGCSSPDPAPRHNCQPTVSRTTDHDFPPDRKKNYVTDRLSEVALSCYIIQAQTDASLMQPDWRGEQRWTRFSDKMFSQEDKESWKWPQAPHLSSWHSWRTAWWRSCRKGRCVAAWHTLWRWKIFCRRKNNVDLYSSCQ